MPVQRQESDSIQEVLDGITVKRAEAALRQGEAEALEAENRTRHQDAAGSERIREAKERADGAAAEARAVRHGNCRRWIWLAVSVVVAGVYVIRGASVPLPIGGSDTASWNTAALTLTASPDQDADGDEALTDEQPEVGDHLSSSKLQGQIELEMLTILGNELGKPLGKKSIGYHGAKMEIDGVDEHQTVFVEAFAHIGSFKSGQRRKIATDVLKFVGLRADRPDASFVLAFADDAARSSVVGWLRAVTEQHGIELVVVGLPKSSIEKLMKTQQDQKTGMETGGAEASTPG